MSNTPNEQQLQAFFEREFPHATFVVDKVGNRSATLIQPVDTNHLRPGGTVSGPTIMGLADAALYSAIMGELGMVAMAVTTSLNFNFMRKPLADKALVAECQLLKMGKNLAVGDVRFYSQGETELVAQATGTYALPNHTQSKS